MDRNQSAPANPGASGSSAETNSSRIWIFVLVGLALAVHFFLATRGWASERLIGNEYRQTHTAITAYFIQQEGNFSLAYPTPLLGKPWSLPYEFPLYQWLVVGVSNSTGWQIGQSGRAVTLASFYLMLPALAWLVRRYSGQRDAGWLAVIFTLLCPLYIFYSRAFLIDPLALCLTLWFLRFFVQAIETGRPGAMVAANVFGLAAGLVKIMTLMLFALPLAVYFAMRLWRARATGGWSAVRQVLIRWAATCVVPIVGSYAWIKFADAIKAQHPSAKALMSESMHSYHFGTWSDRISGEWWARMGEIVTQNVAGTAVLIACAVGALHAALMRKPRIVGLLLMFASGPLIFPRLYAIHEYYFVAVGMCVTAALGMLVAGHVREARFRAGAVMLISLIIAAQLGGYLRFLYPLQHEVLQIDLGLAGLLRDASDPDDVLIVVGDDWAPMLPYAAKRRAMMLRTYTERDPKMVAELLDNLEGEQVAAFVAKGTDPHYDAVREEVTRRFGLVLEPVVTEDDYTVWADASHRERIIKAMGRKPYGGVVLTDHAKADYHRLVDPRQSFADLPGGVQSALRKVSRWVGVVESDFPIASFDYDGKRSLGGHPPQTIELTAKAGRQTLDLTYGLMDGSFAEELKTDGVGFSIKVRRANGQVEVLWRRVLRPAANPDDRGPQSHQMEVELAPGDVLMVATDRGDAADGGFDWAYWHRIELH